MIVRKNKLKNADFWRGSTITIISVVCFLLVMTIIFASNRFMNFCIERESAAQENRTQLKQLGESLSEASDYLTDEARKYAITGDIQHLYNYWNDVLEVKTRDKIIDTLADCDPPQNERTLLAKAKNYSDLLINTETRSMKLMLLSKGKTKEDFKGGKLYDYVEMVMDFKLPDEDKSLNAEEMSEKAVEILFDANYSRYKDLINSPIDEFKETMNERLDKTVAKSTGGIKTASFIQIISSGAVLIFIGALLIMINRLYTKPLNDCTEELNLVENDGLEGSTLTTVRVKPRGAYELKKLAVMFNKLSAVLYSELETRKRAEQAMREAKDEADKANSAKSDFLARMSHELRTPLNAIIGYLYLLKKCSIDEREQDYIRKISLSAENLLGLISDILDFSKIESGNLTFENVDFSLTGLISEVCAVMENGITQKGLKFTVDVSNSIPQIVKGDPLRLRQVLINLLGNAQKFTEKGEVKLSTYTAEKNENLYSVVFSVKDTGIGIKPEDMQKILEPFVQSDAGVSRKYGGTGLGVSISNMIVKEASGGKYSLEIKSEYAKGSEFSFIMDLEKGNPENVENLSDEIPEHEIAGEKNVLLVDDSKINLEMESEIIRSFGVNVDTADNGKEAVKLAGQKKYDMILLDIRMPDMDGYACAKKIRHIECCKYVPIIALSADVVAGVSDKAIESGMNDYASKPLKPKKLYEIMQKYFELAVSAPEEIAADKTRYFDYKSCLYNLGENEKTLCRLAESFISSHTKTKKYILLHIESGDFSNACAILHNVIGTAGNLGCHRLSEAAMELKNNLHKGKTDGLESFSEIWEKTYNEIEAYLSLHKIEKISEGCEDFDELAERLYNLSCDYDISAVELFDDCKSVFKKNMSKDTFEKLKDAAEKYDFETICSVIENSKKE